jgi:hypothetical protein
LNEQDWEQKMSSSVEDKDKTEEDMSMSTSISHFVEDSDLFPLPPDGGKEIIQNSITKSDTRARELMNAFFVRVHDNIGSGAGSTDPDIEVRNSHVPGGPSPEVWVARLRIDRSKQLINCRKWSLAAARLMEKAGFETLTVDLKEKEHVGDDWITYSFTLPGRPGRPGRPVGAHPDTEDGAPVEDPDTGLRCFPASRLADALHAHRGMHIKQAVRDTWRAMSSGFGSMCTYQYERRAPEDFKHAITEPVPGFAGRPWFWKVYSIGGSYLDIDVSDVGYIVRASFIGCRNLQPVRERMGQACFTQVKRDISAHVCERARKSGYDAKLLGNGDIFVASPSLFSC